MWTLLPVEHGEGMQVLRYQGGEKYDAHYDYFSDSENVKNGGNRVATVLMYLADTDEGGETVRVLTDMWLHQHAVGLTVVCPHLYPRRFPMCLLLPEPMLISPTVPSHSLQHNPAKGTQSCFIQ